MNTGSFLPKTFNYRQDGSGRDSYISFNNGGFSTPRKTFTYSAGSASSKSQTHFGNPGNRTVRYSGNGTGRDTYILSDSGGFECGSYKTLKFDQALRSYNNSARRSSGWQRKGQRMLTREIKKRQEINDMRLSSAKFFTVYN